MRTISSILPALLPSFLVSTIHEKWKQGGGGITSLTKYFEQVELQFVCSSVVVFVADLDLEVSDPQGTMRVALQASLQTKTVLSLSLPGLGYDSGIY